MILTRASSLKFFYHEGHLYQLANKKTLFSLKFITEIQQKEPC